MLKNKAIDKGDSVSRKKKVTKKGQAEKEWEKTEHQVSLENTTSQGNHLLIG